MKINVKLIATYQNNLPAGTIGNTIEIDVPPQTTVKDVMTRFNIPLDDTSVIVLNGLTVDLDTPLVENDTVSAFSAIAGG